MSKIYHSTIVQDDDGEAILPLPPELVEELGLQNILQVEIEITDEGDLHLIPLFD